MHHKTGHFSITNYLFSANFGCPIPKIFIWLHDFFHVCGLDTTILTHEYINWFCFLVSKLKVINEGRRIKLINYWKPINLMLSSFILLADQSKECSVCVLDIRLKLYCSITILLNSYLIHYQLMVAVTSHNDFEQLIPVVSVIDVNRVNDSCPNSTHIQWRI